MATTKQKGVLFFLGGWNVGGVERVTVTLANAWIARGRAVLDGMVKTAGEIEKSFAISPILNQWEQLFTSLEIPSAAR